MLNLIGFLLPALIDMFNRRIKDSDTRFWVSVLVCIAVGTAVNVIQTNGFEGYVTLLDYAENIAMSSMAMFGMAQLTYKKIWENSEVRDGLGLNAKTL